MHSEGEDLCLNSEVNPLALGFYGRFDRWILLNSRTGRVWSMTAAHGEAICDSDTAMIKHVSEQEQEHAVCYSLIIQTHCLIRL